MADNEMIIRHAHIFTPEGLAAVKGEKMRSLREIKDGAVHVRDGRIVWVGEDKDLPTDLSEGVGLGETTVIDAAGKALLPGFVDSHTHMIFGGYRPDEFEWRMRGDSYMSIMERGGGIQRTVDATRDASPEELRDRAQWFVDKMVEMGVTTVEAKSGYGLDTATEMKMLDVIAGLQQAPGQKIDIVSTFLPAHAVPREYKGRTDEYVSLMIEEMIPEAKGKAHFFDIFTEKNVFEIDDSRRLLQAAREAGFRLKLHADEIVTLGGAELAAEMEAVSADHLLHVSDEGIRRMAESGTIATLLPLTAFSLKEPFAPARKFIDGGCAVALATDLNPGSCFSGSIPLTIALACIYMGMSIEETVTALTLNGAAAVDMAAETGSVEPGKLANMIILDFDDIRMLPYYVGMNCVGTVIHRGVIVKQD